MELPGQSAPCIALLLAFSLPVAGQDQHGSADAPTTALSPYAGMERGTVKALSDQQIADLKAGRGMGLALVAELNGYPGPVHVLELSDALQLTQERRTRTTTLFEAMKLETIPISERIIADEMALDRLFVEKGVTPILLNGVTPRIGAAQGMLRSAHLRYHLAMVDLPAQVARYAELRGYVTNGRRRSPAMRNCVATSQTAIPTVIHDKRCQPSDHMLTSAL